MLTKHFGHLLVCGLGLATIAACESAERAVEHIEPAAVSSAADPENPAQVAIGERVYQAKCASCHGRELEGQPNWRRALLYGGYPAPPHDGSGHTWHHADQHLFDATKLGGEASAGDGKVSHMPGFGELLSDAEIWATLAYVKSHWSEELRERQRRASRDGAHHHGATHSGH